MGVLSRLNTLIKSNLNAAVDRMSNPAREIDILVAEMEDALKAARLEVQANLASEKLAVKQRDRLLQESKEWEDRAARAVKAGDDNLARKALEQKAQLDTQAEAADRTLREQEAYVDQLSQSLKELEARVKEVKLRKSSLKQQAKMNAGRAGKKGGSAFADFERLSSKVDAMDAESQLDSELAMTKGAQNTLTRQVNDLTGENTQLKEELAFLQRLFADSSKQTGLWIPRMTLERENEEAWHYSLLIARGGAQSDDFQGHVGLLAIVIPPDGAPRTLSVPDEQPDLEKSLALKFKYYQRLEGTLRVPAGAKVTALTARVYDGTGTSPRATRTLTNP